MLQASVQMHPYFVRHLRFDVFFSPILLAMNLNTLITILCIALVQFSLDAYACQGMTAHPTKKDMKYPPDGMMAFSGIIEEIKENGSIDRVPHRGFSILFSVEKIYQGKKVGSSLNVNFGPCHDLPGTIGDSVYVLALPGKERGWYAPQFWKRSNEKKTVECIDGNTYYGFRKSDSSFVEDTSGEAYLCTSGNLIPLGFDPRKVK